MCVHMYVYTFVHVRVLPNTCVDPPPPAVSTGSKPSPGVNRHLRLLCTSPHPNPPTRPSSPVFPTGSRPDPLSCGSPYPRSGRTVCGKTNQTVVVHSGNVPPPRPFTGYWRPRDRVDLDGTTTGTVRHLRHRSGRKRSETTLLGARDGVPFRVSPIVDPTHVLW